MVDKAIDVLPARFRVVPSSVHSDLRKYFTILWSRKAKHLNCVSLRPKERRCRGREAGALHWEQVLLLALLCTSGVSSVKHLRSSW